MPQLTENRETLNHRAAEQTAFARTVESGHFFITNEAVMNGNSSTFFCKEYLEPRISRISSVQSILNDHVKIGPATGIELFESAGTLVKKYKYRHDNQEPPRLGCVHHEELNNTPDNTIPTETDLQISGPRHHNSQ